MHWVAMFQESEGIIETFDSFGKDLGSYSHFLREFGARQGQIISQSHQLQSDSSTTCGQFSMFFLLRRASDETYQQILHLFTDSLVSNDILVCQYVNFYFDLHTPILDKTFANQIAKSLKELN